MYIPEYLFSNWDISPLVSYVVSNVVNPANPRDYHHIIPASATYEIILQIHETTCLNDMYTLVHIATYVVQCGYK